MWYLWKSPQRAGGAWRSWRTELRGLWSIARNGNRTVLQGVSICTGIKNRSQNYLNFVLGSVEQMNHPELIELCISDCASADIPGLEAKIRERWQGSLKFESLAVPFTRSSSFNRAVLLGTQPLIFIADADMTLPPDLVAQCNRWVTKNSVWFPICFWLYQGRPAEISAENGEWWPRGKGMLAARRNQWDSLGGYDESFTQWGGEDWELWSRFWARGLYPYRTRCAGLFHHWHPGHGGGKGRRAGQGN